MKQHLFLGKSQVFLLLILGSSLGSFGQVNFGVRGGLAFSSFENNVLLPQLEYASKAEVALLVSPDVALFFGLPLSDHFSIQTELHYLKKGGKIKEDFFLPEYPAGPQKKVSLETKYFSPFIEAPLLVKYYIKKGSFSPSFLAGGSIGYSLSQRLTGDPIFVQTDNQIIYLFTDGEKLPWDSNFFGQGKFNRVDVSGLLGIAVEKAIGHHQLIFDIRYLHDFNDWRTMKLNNNDKVQVRNRNLLLTAGIEF
jgi:hypothetical protein